MASRAICGDRKRGKPLFLMNKKADCLPTSEYVASFSPRHAQRPKFAQPSFGEGGGTLIKMDEYQRLTLLLRKAKMRETLQKNDLFVACWAERWLSGRKRRTRNPV
jgi:hypothetical protein